MVFRLEGVRVPVVDDAHYVREVVAEILTRDGAKVTAVGSADMAVIRPTSQAMRLQAGERLQKFRPAARVNVKNASTEIGSPASPP